MPRLPVLTLALAALVSGSSAASAADLDYVYRGPRTERTVIERSTGWSPGYHFPDRPYGLAAIPFSVGPSGAYHARVIGYVRTTCTPYTYRYYGGCSPTGYGVF
jgi:hypothetical protein